MHKKSQAQRLLSLLMSSTLAFTMLTPALAYNQIIESGTLLTGQSIVAINSDATVFESTSNRETVGSVPSSSSSPSYDIGGEDLPSNVYGYDQNGRGIIDPKSTLPTAEPIPFGSPMPLNATFSAEPYEVGYTKNLKVDVDTANTSVAFKVVAVGEHCTVWTPILGYYPITEQEAALIVAEFDSKYDDMRTYYGDPMSGKNVDPDSDGKIAIACYDIDGDGTPSGTAYVAGYFYSSDMPGYSNSSDHNNMDMIHIDSALGMVSGVTQCFDTLTHELAHLITFTQVGQYAFGNIPIFIHEAIAESSVHFLSGDGIHQGRMDYFNGYAFDYVSTSGNASLTAWGGQLSNYSLAYLFGQYVRTQYSITAPNSDFNGSMIYRDMFPLFAEEIEGMYKELSSGEAFDAQAAKEAVLAMLADMLHVKDGSTLIENFYIALEAKNDIGAYGFKGEPFAEQIEVPYATGTQSLIPGGALYYKNTSTFTPSGEGSNIAFYGIKQESPPNPRANVAGGPMIDAEDLGAIASPLNYNSVATPDDPLDVNQDGKINFVDLATVRNTNNFGKIVE